MTDYKIIKQKPTQHAVGQPTGKEQLFSHHKLQECNNLAK